MEITVRLNDEPSVHTWKSTGRYAHTNFRGVEAWDWRKDVTVSMSKRGRHTVVAQVVRENPRTVIVRLPNGSVIKRKKDRDAA